MVTERLEERAEVIVRSLHGRVPAWAGGAFVAHASTAPAMARADGPGFFDTEPEDDYDGCWFQDATFEAVGHTGVGHCDVHGGVAYFSVWRRPSRADIRRFCARTYPKMLSASFSENYLTGEPMHCLAAWIGGNYRIVSIIVGRGAPVSLPPHEKHHFGIDFGRRYGWQAMNPESIQAMIALRRRYEWTVAMSIDGAPKLRFSCTPGAAREAFRLRDLPPGKSRRDALIHWVAEHYRKPEIHVSEHLRGKHVFSWRGIDCEIIPSAFDREKEIARKARPTTARASRGSRHASR